MLIYRIIEKSISKVIDDEPFSTLFKKETNYLSYLFFLKKIALTQVYSNINSFPY